MYVIPNRLQKVQIDAFPHKPNTQIKKAFIETEVLGEERRDFLD